MPLVSWSGLSQYRSQFLGVLTAITAVTLLAALYLQHSERGVFAVILQHVAWLKGGPAPAVTTWPAWGYALLIAALGSTDWVLALQIVLGCTALAVFAVRMRQIMPREGVLLMVLCVLAIPWHNIQVTLYPSAIPGALVLVALMVLDAALAANSMPMAMIAGVLVGLAQNFRTEFVALPLFVCACLYVLNKVSALPRLSLRPLVAFASLALVCQVPWALFFHSQTGHYSLTESNFGHVFYLSLGTNPNNPWRIEASDEGSARALREAGHPESSLSDAGSRILLTLARERLKQHPWALVGRSKQLAQDTIFAPFNWGEPALDARGTLDLDVLRQELKARLGVGVNVAKLASYRARGLYASSRSNVAARWALVYQAATTALGSAVFLLSLCGMLLVFWRRELQPRATLLYLLGVCAIYKTLQDLLLAYQVNYLNNVYPMFLPFACLSLSTIADWVRSRSRSAKSTGSSDLLEKETR